MNISKNTWHYRVYDFWFKQKVGSSLEEYTNRWGLRRTMDLCPYVRAILLWAPFRFFFSRPRIWFTLSAFFAIFLGLTYKCAGLDGLLKFGEFLLSFAAAMLALIAVFWAGEKVQERLRKHPVKAITSFTEVLVKQVKAAHGGICPIITFVDEGPYDASGDAPPEGFHERT